MMQSITHVSTAVTVKLCHSTVNNRSNRQTLCAPSTVNNMHVASEATVKWNQRERERERTRKKCLLQVCLPPCWLVLVKTAGRASGTRTSRLWTSPLALSFCGRRRVVGDVPLCFCGAELSAEGNSSFTRRCGGWPTRRASFLSFSVVCPSPSSFRGSLRLGELGVAVLCRVEYLFVSRGRWVGDLAQERTFVGTFPPLNTFPTGPRPVFFSLLGGCRSISCSLVCLLFS